MGRKQSVLNHRREDIPNIDGLRLIVLTFGGEWIKTEVVLVDGIYRLKHTSIDRVYGWKLDK